MIIRENAMSVSAFDGVMIFAHKDMFMFSSRKHDLDTTEGKRASLDLIKRAPEYEIITGEDSQGRKWLGKHARKFGVVLYVVNKDNNVVQVSCDQYANYIQQMVMKAAEKDIVGFLKTTSVSA